MSLYGNVLYNSSFTCDWHSASCIPTLDSDSLTPCHLHFANIFLEGQLAKSYKLHTLTSIEAEKSDGTGRSFYLVTHHLPNCISAFPPFCPCMPPSASELFCLPTLLPFLLSAFLPFCLSASFFLALVPSCLSPKLPFCLSDFLPLKDEGMYHRSIHHSASYTYHNKASIHSLIVEGWLFW